MSAVSVSSPERLHDAGAVRILLSTAALYAASGLFHLGVWAFDGGAWGGDVSWRKPIVFGLSGAATTASLAWALTKLPSQRTTRRWTFVYVVAMTLEIGLITMQRWRGVASHFNRTTALDQVLFAAMGLLILTASVPIIVWTVAALRARELAPDVRASIGGGLLLLDLGLVAGVTLAAFGDAGRLVPSATLLAWASALKPAHAIALHGAQTIPALARLLRRRIADERRRGQMLWTASAGQALVMFGTTLFFGGAGVAGFAALSIGAAMFFGPALAGLVTVPSPTRLGDVR